MSWVIGDININKWNNEDEVDDITNGVLGRNNCSKLNVTFHKTDNTGFVHLSNMVSIGKIYDLLGWANRLKWEINCELNYVEMSNCLFRVGKMKIVNNKYTIEFSETNRRISDFGTHELVKELASRL